MPCRAELEKLAAAADGWRQVQGVLRREETLRRQRNHAAASSASGAADSFHVDDSEEFDDPIVRTADFAVDFLEPASRPEALGRLANIEIRQFIGRGGNGIVLKGFQEELNRLVAVKVMAPHLATSAAARRRFSREARAAAAVVHPSVMPILHVDSSGRLPFLVMPYMDCESLQDRLDREGPLPLLDVLRIGIQVARGLAAAHAQGLIHRDVKPANILLERGVERVMLTDFGLARAVDDASLTRSGLIAGTPQYMSPEQARGDVLDTRSDLFSLGSVMYAICTGRSPFRAETSYGILRRVTDHAARPATELNTDVPNWFDVVIQKLLAKSPDERFGSAGVVAELLEQCLAHAQQPAGSRLPEQILRLLPEPLRESAGSSRWHRRRVAVCAIVAAAISGAVLWLVMLKSGDRVNELDRTESTVSQSISNPQPRTTHQTTGPPVRDDTKDLEHADVNSGLDADELDKHIEALDREFDVLLKEVTSQ